MDTLSPQKRSKLMSSIRSRDTGPEKIVRKIVSALGFRYRLNAKKLIGKPDLVFVRLKKVIFVHGCYWHGHVCRSGKFPKTRTKFWVAKIERNKARDKRIVRKLRRTGWSVMIVWECRLKKEAEVASRISKFLGPEL